MPLLISKKDLVNLFTKNYGEKPVSKSTWSKYYDDNVIFIDPTQKRIGLQSYIQAQDNLVNRCDDIDLKTHAISLTDHVGFVEWTLRLKIMGREFEYPGITRLLFSDNGKITEHRDFFDFVGPTFGPIPLLGGFIRWIYRVFVS